MGGLAYRSAANEAFRGERLPILRPSQEAKGPADAGRHAPPMRQSRKAAHAFEHVFAQRKHRIGLFIRTIGVARARLKIGMANIVDNFKRLVFWRRTAPSDAPQARRAAFADACRTHPGRFTWRNHEVGSVGSMLLAKRPTSCVLRCLKIHQHAKSYASSVAAR
jgi:hypothetical protein